MTTTGNVQSKRARPDISAGVIPQEPSTHPDMSIRERALRLAKEATRIAEEAMKIADEVSET
jgi:hypothetical protein